MSCNELYQFNCPQCGKLHILSDIETTDLGVRCLDCIAFTSMPFSTLMEIINEEWGIDTVGLPPAKIEALITKAAFHLFDITVRVGWLENPQVVMLLA